MQISSRFTIAIHMLACIDIFQDRFKITSEFLSSSINVNPVIIRNILLKLRNAGIVKVQRGSGGASISKDYKDITFLDIYNAVECIDKGTLFHFHENPNKECPVGRNIHNVLDGKLIEVQNALEDELKTITLADVIDDMRMAIANEKTKSN